MFLPNENHVVGPVAPEIWINPESDYPGNSANVTFWDGENVTF